MKLYEMHAREAFVDNCDLGKIPVTVVVTVEVTNQKLKNIVLLSWRIINIPMHMQTKYT